MRRRATSGRLRIIACVLRAGCKGGQPAGLARCAGDAMRCGAMRCDLEAGCQNHRCRHLRKRVLRISGLQELVCLVQPLAGPNARFVPVLLSSPPLSSPPLPLPLPSSQRCPPSAVLPRTRARARTCTPTRLARRRRSPMPDQEAKLLGVSHAGPPPPTLPSFNRCQSCASAREASIRTEFHTRTIASPLQFRMSWRS
jgi:hypothetical protein